MLNLFQKLHKISFINFYFNYRIQSYKIPLFEKKICLYNTLVLRNKEITAPFPDRLFDLLEEKWWQFQFVDFNVIIFMELALHLSEAKDVNALTSPKQ